MRYYGKIHSKLPIFRVKSEKNLHLPEKFTLTASAASATIIWYACQTHKRKIPQFKDKGVGFDGLPMAVEEDVRTLPADAHLGHLGHQGGAARVHPDQENICEITVFLQ